MRAFPPDRKRIAFIGLCAAAFAVGTWYLASTSSGMRRTGGLVSLVIICAAIIGALLRLRPGPSIVMSAEGLTVRRIARTINARWCEVRDISAIMYAPIPYLWKRPDLDSLFDTSYFVIHLKSGSRIRIDQGSSTMPMQHLRDMIVAEWYAAQHRPPSGSPTP